MDGQEPTAISSNTMETNGRPAPRKKLTVRRISPWPLLRLQIPKTGKHLSPFSLQVPTMDLFLCGTPQVS